MQRARRDLPVPILGRMDPLRRDPRLRGSEMGSEVGWQLAPEYSGSRSFNALECPWSTAPSRHMGGMRQVVRKEVKLLTRVRDWSLPQESSDEGMSEDPDGCDVGCAA